MARTWTALAALAGLLPLAQSFVVGSCVGRHVALTSEGAAKVSTRRVQNVVGVRGGVSTVQTILDKMNEVMDI